MKNQTRVTNQIKSNFYLLLKLYVPAMLILTGIVMIRIFRHIPIGEMTRDPVQIMHGNPFYGFLSNMGIILWCATGSICLFSAALLRQSEKKGRYVSFLFYSGLITFLLMVDDFFLLHDIVFPEYLGIPENLIYMVYIFLIGFYLFRFRSHILETDYTILILSFLFLGFSLVIDRLPFYMPGHFIFEDGLKFFAIVTWMGYFIRVCNQALCKNG